VLNSFVSSAASIFAHNITRKKRCHALPGLRAAAISKVATDRFSACLRFPPKIQSLPVLMPITKAPPLIYYPDLHPPVGWLRSVLLLTDEVRRIVPDDVVTNDPPRLAE